jgi:hypothetical protein
MRPPFSLISCREPRMTDEAEKVITMSLSKMAESRTVRRGGTSLHKHLLISSVLTKARVAYLADLETWYTEPEPLQGPSATPIPPSASFLQVPHGQGQDQDQDPNSGSGSLLDPRFYVQVESEVIDLPPDILHCVEKLGELSEWRSGSGSLLDEVDAATADMILSDVREEETTTYLDLDLDQSKNKRRRAWSLEDDEGDSDDEGEAGEAVFKDKSHLAKRQRFSVPPDDGETFSFRSSSLQVSPAPMALDPFFTSFTSKGSNFRTKKSHFEVEEEEEEEDVDSFLEEDDMGLGLGLGLSWQGGREANVKHDRRVPSSNGSSSSSSSDEEVEPLSVSAMEVDNLTSLVKYISFKQPVVGAGAGGLSRSVSSPDLCSRPSGDTDSSPTTGTGTSPTQTKPTAKDLFSSFSSSNHHHHHFLTMKV